MTDKLTRIMMKDGHAGTSMMDWGEHSWQHMYDMLRKHAEQQKRDAEAVLNAKPDDFVVDVVLGQLVQRHVKKVERET